MTWIKLCGLVRPEDVEFAGELGVNAVGIVAVPESPRFVSLAEARQISRAPRGDCRLTLVVRDAGRELITVYIEACNPDLLQFHGNESPAYCASFGMPYIKVVRSGSPADLTELGAHTEAAFWMMDVKHSISQAPDLFAQGDSRPWILAGGLGVQNVADRIRLLHPYGVDVSRGIEREPRKKDHQLMRAFIHAVRSI